MENTLENQHVLQFHEMLYLNADISDVNFIFFDHEEQKVASHKVILAAGSAVFKQMFFGSMKEKGDVSITDVSIDSYCWGYQLAIMLKINDLITFFEDEISFHINIVFRSESFIRCAAITLKRILEMETLWCNETDVFNACLMWAKFACTKSGLDENNGEHLRMQLGDCFDLIRFGAMSIEEFSTHATLCKDLFRLDEIKDIMFTTTNKEPSKFLHKPRSGPVISWDAANILKCTRFSRSSQTTTYIQTPESVWFRTNVAAVLGEIWLSSINSRDGNGIGFELSIYECNSIRSFNGPKRRLITDHVTLVKSSISKCVLTEKVLVNPLKMYEISLQSSAINGCYHNYKWQSQATTDEVIVFFFKNSKIVDAERHGLVHSLLFNRYIC